MELTFSKLVELLSEAFDQGYSGIAEQRGGIIKDVLERHEIRKEDDTPPPKPPEKNEDFRTYKIIELREFPVGTVFNHATLGKCHIANRGNDKYMAFENPGLAPSGFNVDGYPWEIPMQLVEAFQKKLA